MYKDGGTWSLTAAVCRDPLPGCFPADSKLLLGRATIDRWQAADGAAARPDEER